MLVVSDTTPLNYLVLINAVDILPRLFDRVLIPKSVVRELQHPKAPDAVRMWANKTPEWLTIREPTERLPSTADLDDGEADAISVAKEMRISDLLIDEYHGRKVAEAEGMSTLTTIAILKRAAEREIVDPPSMLDALPRTSYRIRPEIIQSALDRDAIRKKSGRPSP